MLYKPIQVFYFFFFFCPSNCDILPQCIDIVLGVGGGTFSIKPDDRFSFPVRHRLQVLMFSASAFNMVEGEDRGWVESRDPST